MLSLLSSLHNLGEKERAYGFASGGMRQGAGRVHLQSNMPLIASSCQVSGMLTGDDEAAGDCALCFLPPRVMWPSSTPSCTQLGASQYLLGSFPLRAPGF